MLATAPKTKPGGWLKRPGWANGDEPFVNVFPNITYADRMTLHDAADGEVRLLWLGRAHTSGDTIVHLPAQRIVFIGDVGFFGVTPLMGDGYCSDWIAICDRILAMDVQTRSPATAMSAARTICGQCATIS